MNRRNMYGIRRLNYAGVEEAELCQAELESESIE